MREDRERWDNILTRELALANDRIAKGSVAPTLDFTSFRGELADFDFRTPCPMAGDVLDHHAVGAWPCSCDASPIFRAIQPCSDFSCAMRRSYRRGIQSAVGDFDHVSGAVEIEAHVIRSVGRRAGFSPEVTGHFTTGGAEANYTALICALTRSNAGFASEGARAFKGAPMFYTSQRQPSCVA